MRAIIGFLINRLWAQYSKDKNVLYNPKPIGGYVLSVEGFFLWLRGKHPEIKK